MANVSNRTKFFVNMAKVANSLSPYETKKLTEELKDLCYDLHGCDCEECPVYAVNNEIPNNENSRWGCDCFKDGHKMMKFIK